MAILDMLSHIAFSTASTITTNSHRPYYLVNPEGEGKVRTGNPATYPVFSIPFPIKASALYTGE